MATDSIKHDTVEDVDILRFGLAGVKRENVGSGPLEFRENCTKFWEEKKRMGLALTYGSSFNLRKDFDAQILSKFQRPSAALPSSMLGFEALTGSLDDFGFEDYLNLPQDSESFRPAEMHHGMEVKLGLSKGPAYPSRF
ncbi:hypothetical protein LUZ60_008269 [Juncus effusus]|nr:hypothetical protein LUZ60_008269 [Juncus effusus]